MDLKRDKRPVFHVRLKKRRRKNLYVYEPPIELTGGLITASFQNCVQPRHARRNGCARGHMEEREYQDDTSSPAELETSVSYLSVNT